MPKTATPPAQRFFDVPAGTKPTMCRGSTCGRLFYWVRVDGQAIPVDVNVPDGLKPSEHANDPTQQNLFATPAAERHHDGRGVRHHTCCPDVDEFRRRS
jgi:hypothetical protein